MGDTQLKIVYRRLTCLFCLLACSSPLLAGELEEHKAIVSNVASLFAEENFDKLDKLAEEYRSSNSRTSSGIWKLTVFYTGIFQAVDTTIQEEKYWQDI